MAKETEPDAWRLRIHNSDHEALLCAKLELLQYSIRYAEGENTPVNRGIAAALEYLLSRQQTWAYEADVQLHIISSLEARLSSTHLSMIMGRLRGDLLSLATAQTAREELARMSPMAGYGKHRGSVTNNRR